MELKCYFDSFSSSCSWPVIARVGTEPKFFCFLRATAGRSLEYSALIPPKLKKKNFLAEVCSRTGPVVGDGPSVALRAPS